jgi:hypothetical protein
VQPRGLGCLGKGCLILSIFFLFLIVAGAVGVYFGFKKNSAVLRGIYWAQSANVIASEPASITRFEATEENMEAAARKWRDFERASHHGQPAHVELGADDLNNLIARDRHLRGNAFATIDGNRLRLQMSLPLREILKREGYYLNGDVVIQTNGPASIENPPLSSITINGQTLPKDLLDWRFRSRALRNYADKYRDTASTFEIRDGKIILDNSGP